MKNLIIVMAAGASTRFKTTKSKLLQNLAGSSLISYLLSSLENIDNVDIIFVVKHQKEELIKEIEKEYKAKNISFVEQKSLDGTAGAVRDALSSLNNDYEKVLVLPADTPLVPSELMKESLNVDDLAFVLGLDLDDKTYGRFLLEDNKLAKIIEPQSDLYAKTTNIVNTSIYSFNYDFLKTNILEIPKNSAKNEFFLTDIIELAFKANSISYKVLPTNMSYKVLGPNNLIALSKLNKKVYRERVNQFMDNGVYFVDKKSVYIDKTVEIDKDVIIYPNVFLKGTTKINAGVEIYEGSRIKNTKIGQNTIVKPYSLIFDSKIGAQNTIGPFVNIRFNTNTDTGVKIGAFAETKNITVGQNSKIPHLSYVGDATLGERVNIGCGVITCNYDGFKKSKTTIGNDVFVGSDSQLIAPVILGDGAYVAAGTTVTKDIPEDALAISRTAQVNKENFVKKFKERKKNA